MRLDQRRINQNKLALYKSQNPLVYTLFFGATVAIISMLMFVLSSDFNPIVGLILFVGGVCITHVAISCGVISRFNTWINALHVYTIISTSVFFVFWYFPLSELGKLTTSTQIDGYQDANYYDHLAHIIHDKPFQEWPSMWGATWLSQGVVGYLSIIYRLFGASQFNYVLINILLGFVSILFLQGILTRKNGDFALSALFLPYVLYYNTLPGKEVLNNLFLYLSLFCLFGIFHNPKKVVSLICLFPSLLLLGLVRVNSLISILLLTALYLGIFERKKVVSAKHLIIVVLSCVLLFLLVNLIITQFLGFVSGDFLGLISFESLLEDQSERLYGVDSSSTKYYFASLLTNDNIIIHLLIFPVRLLVWLLAPLPFFIEPFSVAISALLLGDHYSIFRSQDIFRSIDSLLLLIVLMMLVSKIMKVKRFYKGNSSKFLFFYGWGLAFLLSTFSFIEGARYRVVVEPLILSWGFNFLFNTSFQQDQESALHPRKTADI